MGGETGINKGQRAMGSGYMFLLQHHPQDQRDVKVRRGHRAREDGAFTVQGTLLLQGQHCVLHVHNDETRRILQTWMESVWMTVLPSAELLAPTLEKARAAAGASPSRPTSVSSL
jgi:hypothetical protein